MCPQNFQDSSYGPVVVPWTSAGKFNYVTCGVELQEGKRYYFAVKAKNEAGVWSDTGYSDGITFLTIPSAPASLAATALSTSEIKLSWIDTSSNEKGFRLEISRDNRHFSYWGTLSPNTQTWTVRGLWPATQYYFRLYAFNDAGSSIYPAQASAVTKTR